jgi:hypothetical protein
VPYDHEWPVGLHHRIDHQRKGTDGSQNNGVNGREVGSAALGGIHGFADKERSPVRMAFERSVEEM